LGVASCSKPSLPESQESPARVTNNAAATKEVSAVIERTIAAHGGRENFKKMQTGVSNLIMTGMPGMPVDVTMDTKEFFDLPARFRRNASATYAGESIQLSYLITPEGSWQRMKNGDWEPNPLPSDHELTAFPSSTFQTLLALAESPEEVELSSMTTTAGKTVTVLRYPSTISGKSGEVLIDPETNLLYGGKKPIYSADSRDFVELNTFCGDYKTIDNVVIPTTLESYRDNKLTMRIVVKEIIFLEHLDASFFRRD